MTRGKMSSIDWLEQPDFEDIELIDPDGWDRANLDIDMTKLISREEFVTKLANSTIIGDLNSMF